MGAGAGGGAEDEASGDPLDCELQGFALSPGTGALAAAAWRRRFAVFPTPWEHSDVAPLAAYRCPDSPGSLSRDVPACIAFVPGAGQTAVVYASPLLLGKALVYDYRRSAALLSVGLTQMARCMDLAPEGRARGLMAFGGTGGTVFVVDGVTGSVAQLSGHPGPVSALRFVTGTTGQGAAEGGRRGAEGREELRLVAACGGTLHVWRVPLPPRT